jgi:hypothetical protein
LVGTDQVFKVFDELAGTSMISETHSRGLRKLLFAQLADTYPPEAFDLLNKALRHASMPMPSNRIRDDAFNRVRAQLKRTGILFLVDGAKGARMVYGYSLREQAIAHSDGGSELALLLQCRGLAERDSGFSAREFSIAKIGQHAIERMFQRLNTSDVGSVVTEIMLTAEFLCVLVGWGIREWRRSEFPSQIVVPTTRGAFLCRSTDGACIDVRTFVSDQMSDRLNASVAGARNAFQEFIQSPQSGPALLDILLRDPRNWWWDRRKDSAD